VSVVPIIIGVLGSIPEAIICRTLEYNSCVAEICTVEHLLYFETLFDMQLGWPCVRNIIVLNPDVLSILCNIIIIIKTMLCNATLTLFCCVVKHYNSINTCIADRI